MTWSESDLHDWAVQKWYNSFKDNCDLVEDHDARVKMYCIPLSEAVCIIFVKVFLSKMARSMKGLFLCDCWRHKIKIIEWAEGYFKKCILQMFWRLKKVNRSVFVIHDRNWFEGVDINLDW